MMFTFKPFLNEVVVWSYKLLIILIIKTHALKIYHYRFVYIKNVYLNTIWGSI